MANGFYNRVTRALPIQTASVSLKDLEQLAKIIESKNAEAVIIERMSINELAIDEEEKTKYNELIPSIQKITIFIYGTDGENVISYDPSIFQNHLLPPKISEVTIETQTFRQVQAKSDSPNHIRLHFDFARFSYGSPKVTASGHVVNNSVLQVQGQNEAWVTSAFKALSDRLIKVQNSRRPLHATGTYQLALFFLAIPLIVLLLDQAYNDYQASFDKFGLIARLGILVYGFLFGVLLYRTLYNYAMWAFPAVDLMDDRDRSAGHRKFWFSVITSLFVGFVSYYLYRR